MSDAAPALPPALSIDGAVATITLRRPAQANRLEPSDLDTLLSQVEACNADPRVLVLRIRSTGRYFCSGFEIGRIGAGDHVAFDRMVDAVEHARPITIAVVHGGVYGGATDLALACDFRIGTTAVDMFMPAARLGLHYYRSGLERYVSRLGIDMAKRLFLTAERIDAQRMLACGFLTDLVEPAALDAAVDDLTQSLRSMAPIPLIAMKKNLNRIARGTLDADELAADIAQARASEDLKEGTAAFAERRAPRFAGR
ncbi:MAG: enoyl-CoA hydratase/isomerase family protein [Lautropia sp.]